MLFSWLLQPGGDGCSDWLCASSWEDWSGSTGLVLPRLSARAGASVEAVVTEHLDRGASSEPPPADGDWGTFAALANAS
jgi:hypothetical protein